MLLAATFEMVAAVMSIRDCVVTGGERKVKCESVGEIPVQELQVSRKVPMRVQSQVTRAPSDQAY